MSEQKEFTRVQERPVFARPFSPHMNDIGGASKNEQFRSDPAYADHVALQT